MLSRNILISLVKKLALNPIYDFTQFKCWKWKWIFDWYICRNLKLKKIQRKCFGVFGQSDIIGCQIQKRFSKLHFRYTSLRVESRLRRSSDLDLKELMECSLGSSTRKLVHGIKTSSSTICQNFDKKSEKVGCYRFLILFEKRMWKISNQQRQIFFQGREIICFSRISVYVTKNVFYENDQYKRQWIIKDESSLSNPNVGLHGEILWSINGGILNTQSIILCRLFSLFLQRVYENLLRKCPALVQRRNIELLDNAKPHKQVSNKKNIRFRLVFSTTSTSLKPSDFHFFFFCSCCRVARTTWLLALPKYKRRHISETQRKRKKSRDRELWKDVGQ